jgi:TonB family protein
LKLTIQRDGGIADSAIERSSGTATLDLTAQRALTLTRVLPPLPGAYPNSTLTIHLTFEYGVRAGKLGTALRNLQHYTADNGQTGPEIQVDTKGVEFTPWIRRFMAQVKRNWFVPREAMANQGHVVITFNVHKDGAITDVEVRTPSSVEAFNNAAYGALVSSNPTQPLPLEYPTEKAFFTVTFYYNEAPPDADNRVPDQPVSLPDQPASQLLNARAVDVEQRLGKPTQIDGHRWTYATRPVLRVYFDDAGVVVDIQPRAFDLSVFKK